MQENHYSIKLRELIRKLKGACAGWHFYEKGAQKIDFTSCGTDFLRLGGLWPAKNLSRSILQIIQCLLCFFFHGTIHTHHFFKHTARLTCLSLTTVANSQLIPGKLSVTARTAGQVFIS